MAENTGGSSAPWIAFLVGILVVALIIVGVYAFNGVPQPQEQAQLEINMPDIELPEAPKISPPDLPDASPLPAPTEAPAPAPH